MRGDMIHRRSDVISKPGAAFLSLTAVLLSIFLIAVPGCKKSEKKTFVVGYVNPHPGEKNGAQGFLRNMSKFGYVEGQNVMYMRCVSKDNKIIEKALREMVAKKVDLIFTVTTPAAAMAKRITEGTNIPVLFIMYDAVGSGTVETLVNHRENITGVQLSGSTAKALEWLLAIRPKARHIFVPVCFDPGASELSLTDLKTTAAKLGMKLTISEVATVDELHVALSSMPKDIDAIFMIHSWLVGCNVRMVLDHAVRRKIPVASAGHVHFDDGVVISYGPRDDRTGSQAARLADRILHGIPAVDLPVETSDFFLGINLKTAQAMSFEIPAEVLQQADFIVRD